MTDKIIRETEEYVKRINRNIRERENERNNRTDAKSEEK